MSAFDVTVSIDLDEHLRGQTHYDADGETYSEPTTLEDVVLAEVVRTVVAKLVTDDLYRGLRQKVLEIRDEVIREAVTPLVTEAIEASVQPTDHYGEPKGEPTTLRAIIVKNAQDYLSKPSGGDYNRKALAPVQAFIAAEVASTVTKELREALDAGKAEVKQALQEQGAKLIAEAIAKTVAA